MRLSVVSVASLALLVNANNAGHQSPSPGRKQPNIVLIMSDDQDKLLNSLDYQPAVQKHFIREGLTFENHFCTMAQCCPSRVSLLTGKAGHNTNVTDVFPPYGGYPKFISQGLNDDYLPVWLQASGYNTYYVGKLMNSHSEANYNDPFPGGWNGTDFLLEPNIYLYYNATWQRNKSPPYGTPGQYSTDLVSQKSLAYIDDAVRAKAKDGRPFFMGIMPIGPHAEAWGNAAGQLFFAPPVPAKRHEHLYPGVKIPRTYNFNPDVPGSVSYLQTLPKFNDTAVAFLDSFYRKRLQALASVDEMIDAVFAKLEQHNLLEDTYVIYTADNGYHIGQHRLDAGKTTCYEEDVNIPFIIRGPGIEKGVSVDYPTTHTDLAPTIFKLAGIPLRDDFDGAPIPVRKDIEPPKYEQVNIEFWGGNRQEGVDGGASQLPNNTYKTLRLLGPGYNLMYSVWCSNEHELYDMRRDPGQMDNLYGSNAKLFGHSIAKITARLNGLMMVMKSCKGAACIQPWKVLHPDGKVKGIRDALNGKYDQFYEKEMPEVRFDECLLGYIIAAEGPQKPAVFGQSGGEEDKYAYKRNSDWAAWA